MLLSDVPSVLEECVQSVSHPQQMNILLQYHRDLGPLDNHGRSSVSDEDDAEFVDPETGKVEPKYETVMVIGEDGMVQPFEDLSVGKKRSFKKPKIKTDKASGSHGEQMLSIINSKSNVIISSVLYQPSVDLQRVDTTNLILLPFIPVRRNRGLKMKTFLTQEQKQTDTEFSEKYTFKQCQICEKTFSRSADMKRHQQIHTGEHKLVHNPLKCIMCENSFNGRALVSHVKICHAGVRYPCTYCGKLFLSMSSLTRHDLIHTQERPFKCTESECGKGFRSPKELRVHMRYHTGERPYKCKICGKGFTQNCYITRHMRTHTGEKPYPCSVCGRNFSDLRVRKRHMMTHTGEKPYKSSGWLVHSLPNMRHIFPSDYTDPQKTNPILINSHIYWVKYYSVQSQQQDL
uniref:C2H2-type domain-containing protein n=1 Tax=Oncorhynchus mykiss TaxID=8022 RepID=A0A8K9UIU4_ONCMY